MLGKLMVELAPAAMLFLSTAGLAFLGWLTARLNSKYAVEIEQGRKIIEGLDREALHKAFETAAALAIDKGLIGKQAVDFMLQYVFKSTPDAVKGLSATNALLTNIAEAKLADKAGQILKGAASNLLEKMR